MRGLEKIQYLYKNNKEDKNLTTKKKKGLSEKKKNERLNALSEFKMKYEKTQNDVNQIFGISSIKSSQGSMGA